METRHHYHPYLKQNSIFMERLNELFFEAHRQEMNLNRNFIQIRSDLYTSDFGRNEKLTQKTNHDCILISIKRNNGSYV